MLLESQDGVQADWMEEIAVFPLLFLGDQSDRKIPSAFLSAAKDRFVCCAIGGEDFQWIEPADFLVSESSCVTAVQGGGALILKDRFDFSPSRFLCDAVCVVNSQNEKAVRFASQQGLMTIACGPSAYDTLTFSSLTAEKAVVSLQRQILLPGPGGLCAEPADYTVNLKSKPGLYTILAVAAAFILSGNGDFLSELSI